MSLAGLLVQPGEGMESKLVAHPVHTQPAGPWPLVLNNANVLALVSI
jgi:hypothetical protein